MDFLHEFDHLIWGFIERSRNNIGLPTEIFPQLKNNDQLKDTDYIFFMKTNKEIQNFKQGQENRKNKIDFFFFKFIPFNIICGFIKHRNYINIIQNELSLYIYIIIYYISIYFENYILYINIIIVY